MEDSQIDSKIFSVRIVTLDYYMAPPIPAIDICYSRFHGGKVNEVPVIRVYGSTPAGQKTCLHIHRALPYLYVPCADIPINSQQEGDAYTNAISLALEKALKLKGSAGSKRQHVHGCSLVQAKKFYGYHPSEELFVKIYLYNPHDVPRACNLLLGGAVLDKSLQPHESHIPFILQFLVDYNLYGMGLLHLSKMKFRHPAPDVFRPRKSYDQQRVDYLVSTSADFQVDSSSGAYLGFPVWISSTIPGDWMWQHFNESSDHDIHSVKRQSICELEGDATVDDILNQQFKMFTSLSQTDADVKMVQSLIPIWEEEYERTGTHEMAIPPDPRKPLAENVLKSLSLGLGFENKLIGLCSQVEDISSSGKEIGATLPFNDEMVAIPSEVKDICPKLLFAAEQSSKKAADEEVVGLLRWLATSEAAEDINSEDELILETVLSPLLPVTTIDKVLEKANMDYENESQKECQDILDSIENSDDLVGSKETASRSMDYSHHPQTSSKKNIPQVDGSNDDEHLSPYAGSAENFSKTEVRSGSKRASQFLLQEVSRTSFTTKHKRKKLLWGPLPLSPTQKVNVDLETKSVNMTDTCAGKGEDGLNASFLAGNELEKCSDDLKKNIDLDGSDAKETSVLVGCSVRDLMRRKRCYRVEPPDCGSICSKNVLVKEGQNGGMFNDNDRISNFGPSLTNQQIEAYKCSALTNLYPDCTIDGAVPHLVCGDSSFWDSTGPPSVHGAKKELPLNPNNRDSAVLVNHCESCNDKECEFCMTHKEAMNSAVCTTRYAPTGVHLLKFDTESKSLAVEKSKQVDADVSSSLSSYCIEPNIQQCSHGVGTSIKLEVTTETSIVQNVNNHIGNQLKDNGIGTVSMAVMEAKPVDSIGMTFHVKPPTADWTDVAPEKASSSTTAGMSDFDDALPFFAEYCQEEEKAQDKRIKNSDTLFHQEAVMGVRTHYENDGSCLYLLTPALSPPPVNCVYRWLLHDDEGISREINAEFMGPSSPSGSSNSVIGSQSCLPDRCEKTLIKSGSASHMRPNLNQVCESDGIWNAEVNHHHNKVASILQGEENIAKVNACTDHLQDISQISGPDGKSKPTPLSQIGFRDPASVGAGQQLTLLSIEVQAESRGDLKPDPRFDAVNVVALVIQNDNDSIMEVCVLLRGTTESDERNFDGLPDCKVFVFHEEKHLFSHFMMIVCSVDPDILLGWDIQGGSLGFLAERAAYIGIGLLSSISRTSSETKIAAGDSEISEKRNLDNLMPESLIADSVLIEDGVIEDEWGRTHASGVHVGGRVVLNVWRLMRGEVKLNIYSVEAVAEAVLRRKIPSIYDKVLTKWFSSGSGRARYRCVEYVMARAKLNLDILNQLDMISRTSELARVFGIEFFAVLSRGSQYRVESMLLRLAHTQNYLAVSPGNQQVAAQPAMECLPLVMEPESGFYPDPVIVLDFQSLYPSMIIAYNLCFCTCLGKVVPASENILGVSSYAADPNVVRDLEDQILLTPNGVMYVPAKVRKGVLPRLLEEILSTRIMVKQAMKSLPPSQQVLHRIFNARQLALKLIANVTYGYTAAGFSGRMPCAEIADSIVQCGRSTLERAISFINANDKWKAKVIYGDTDSMFVLLRGRSVKEAFEIGRDIASQITAMNPNPVTLKMEKVYYPCFLLTKKRYVGYSYETPDQIEPVFDAKGIETVRRDNCGAVSKTLEKSLRLFFEHQNISEVKAYLQRQWTRIMSGRMSLQDFVFAKEVRLGTYSTRASSSLPPAAIVATKAMKVDPRAEPRYAERVPYVVIHGEPGARLVDMIVDPLDLLAIDSPYRLNDLYYISKQIIPALQRVFGLVGADLYQWFAEMPRPAREASAKRPLYASNPQRTRIDYYYLSKHCILCGELVLASAYLCNMCLQRESATATAIIGRTSKLEREMQHLAAICRHCGGGDWLVESGIKCTSLACSVFYERRKVQKELKGLSGVAADKGLYPKCMVEWF